MCSKLWQRKMRRYRQRRLRHPTGLQSTAIACTLEIHVCMCVRVCVLGPESDFREQRVYKVKCDLCGAAVPRQVEKDPETREVRQPQRNGGWGGNQVFLKISAIWTSRTSPPRRVNSELNLSTTAQDKHVCHQRFWAERVFYTGSPPYSVNGLLWKLRN